MEKKIYYMAIARDSVTLADIAKSHKAKYQQSTNDIIGKLGRGDVIVPFNEMEYAVKNDAAAGGLTYLMLVEKGYYQVKAFQCLDKMKEEFNKFFDRSQIANARYLSLSKEFEGAFERIYEEYSKNTLDKMGVAIEATNNLNKNVTATLDNLIARDEKLDEMMLKTEEMSDLSYSISSKVGSSD